MSILDMLDIVTNLERIRLDKKESFKNVIISLIAILIFVGVLAVCIFNPEYYQNSDGTLLMSFVIAFLICFILYKIKILTHVRPATFLIFLISILFASFIMIRYLAFL